jgi:hypothetical protein
MADLPAGVLILNQSRNVHRPLAAFADIVIEMTMPRTVGITRRRPFTGVGRYPETLQTATADLNPEGTDYILLPDCPAPPPPLFSTLQTLLAASPTPLTRRELFERWPAPAPSPATLWRTSSAATNSASLPSPAKARRRSPIGLVWCGGRICRTWPLDRRKLLARHNAGLSIFSPWQWRDTILLVGGAPGYCQGPLARRDSSGCRVYRGNTESSIYGCTRL